MAKDINDAVIENLMEQNRLLRKMVHDLAGFTVGLMDALPERYMRDKEAQHCLDMAKSILAEFTETTGGPQ